MKTISLAQALKLKNRMAGEISRMRDIINRENSLPETEEARANSRTAFTDLAGKCRDLATLKALIATANTGTPELSGGIYAMLNLQAELRGLIEFLKSLDTKEGNAADSGGFFSRRDPREVKYVAEIKRDEVDRWIGEFQHEIHMLQDTIDEFNSQTTLTWPQ